MGAVLSVLNDCPHDFEILEANIFTPSQGICLQRLTPTNARTFTFDHRLSYGAWYDIQIIARSKSDIEPLRYLRKGIYLNCGKKIKVTELTKENHRDYGKQWECGYCKKENFGSVPICEHCYTNKSQTIIAVLSCIPIVGIPFSLADAVLRCGKAAQSNKKSDGVDATVTTVFALIDVATAPLIVGSLIKIPAKVAAVSGVKLTAKTVFGEAAKLLLKEITKELGKGGVIGGLTAAKGVITAGIIENSE